MPELYNKNLFMQALFSLAIVRLLLYNNRSEKKNPDAAGKPQRGEKQPGFR
jgi:hypothetical protein